MNVVRHRCTELVVLAVSAIAGGFVHADEGSERDSPEHPRYLFVCAGDQARAAPDFLAVVDFDEHSRDYGRVLATRPFPAPDATGNEPHHIGLSADGKVLACGGLLSVLKGQKEVFFFDVEDPRDPRFITAADPPLSSITDEFHALPSGGFLVTMMGGPDGHAPGRVVEFDAHLQLVHEYPDQPPADGFNPHGIAVRPELNLMVTSDFICPATTLHGSSGIEFRGSVRVWDFEHRRVVRTVAVPGAGTIDIKLLPNDRLRRAYTAAMLDDHLYLIDTVGGAATPVFDFGTISPGGWPQLLRLTANGTRLFVSMNKAGKVAMLDTTDPMRPRLIKALDLGAGSGPHYLTLTADERRLVISDYFLNEDSLGEVHAEGDHKIHVARVSAEDLSLDPRFALDFNSAFASGPARPHGLAIK
jgi:selenium-binding protein 1